MNNLLKATYIVDYNKEDWIVLSEYSVKNSS